MKNNLFTLSMRVKYFFSFLSIIMMILTLKRLVVTGDYRLALLIAVSLLLIAFVLSYKIEISESKITFKVLFYRREIKLNNIEKIERSVYGLPSYYIKLKNGSIRISRELNDKDSFEKFFVGKGILIRNEFDSC